MRRKGFTLAEVLVTLVVIGIVAALTIPALLQGTGQTELKTALKKSLTSLNQALVLSIAQDAVNAQTCTDCNTDKTALAQFFMNRLNILSSNMTATDPYFYTADGMKYTISDVTTCTSTVPVDPGDGSDASCTVLVDVNGDKGPNTESSGNGTNAYLFKDRYRLIVRSDTVLPASNGTNDVALRALQQ